MMINNAIFCGEIFWVASPAVPFGELEFVFARHLLLQEFCGQQFIRCDCWWHWDRIVIRYIRFTDSNKWVNLDSVSRFSIRLHLHISNSLIHTHAQMDSFEIWVRSVGRGQSNDWKSFENIKVIGLVREFAFELECVYLIARIKRKCCKSNVISTSHPHPASASRDSMRFNHWIEWCSSSSLANANNLLLLSVWMWWWITGRRDADKCHSLACIRADANNERFRKKKRKKKTFQLCVHCNFSAFAFVYLVESCCCCCYSITLEKYLRTKLFTVTNWCLFTISHLDKSDEMLMTKSHTNRAATEFRSTFPFGRVVPATRERESRRWTFHAV